VDGHPPTPSPMEIFFFLAFFSLTFLLAETGYLTRIEPTPLCPPSYPPSVLPLRGALSSLFQPDSLRPLIFLVRRAFTCRTPAFSRIFALYWSPSIQGAGPLFCPIPLVAAPLGIVVPGEVPRRNRSPFRFLFGLFLVSPRILFLLNQSLSGSPFLNGHLAQPPPPHFS